MYVYIYIYIYIYICIYKYAHGLLGVHIFKSLYMLKDQWFTSDKGCFPPWRFAGALITPKRKKTK